MPRVLQPDSLGTMFRDIFKRLAQLERGTIVIPATSITPGAITSVQVGPSGTPITGAV